MSIRVDCDTCLVRGLACHDCVVTVLLGPTPGEAGDHGSLDSALHGGLHGDLQSGRQHGQLAQQHGAVSFSDDQRSALAVLARAGLVPPLRLVAPVSGPEVESA